MPASVFFDTSVLVYLVKGNDPRADVAEEMLSYGGVINVQILNEFTNVARKKLRMDWEEVRQGIAGICQLCEPVLPITLEIHKEGLRIAQRYGFHIYDSLIVAAAIEAGCSTLYSEDLQDGQIIGPLTIQNPFLA